MTESTSHEAREQDTLVQLGSGVLTFPPTGVVQGYFYIAVPKASTPGIRCSSR